MLAVRAIRRDLERRGGSHGPTDPRRARVLYAVSAEAASGIPTHSFPQTVDGALWCAFILPEVFPCPVCWAEAPLKIARMTLTIKLDGNWSSFQLANNTPPLSVTGSVIAPSARIH